MSELRRSARALARRWWPLAVAVPLGAAAGAGYAVVSHPSYAANSYVIVVPENAGEGSTAVNFAQAYGRLAGQPQVLASAAVEAGHSVTTLSGMVRGTTSPDAPMIEITGTGSKPAEAVKAADAVAKSLITFANASTKETGVHLVSLANAAEPDAPASPSAQLDTAVGAAAGVLLGTLVMLTRRKTADANPQGREALSEGGSAAGRETEEAVPAVSAPRKHRAPEGATRE